jgi:hypothetical protein
VRDMRTAADWILFLRPITENGLDGAAPRPFYCRTAIGRKASGTSSINPCEECLFPAQYLTPEQKPHKKARLPTPCGSTARQGKSGLGMEAQHICLQVSPRMST